MADENKIDVVDPGVGDVFADEALDFDIVNNTLRIRFGIVKPEQPTMPSKQRLIHIGRLIMPLESAQRMAVILNQVLKNAGHDPDDFSTPSDQRLN